MWQPMARMAQWARAKQLKLRFKSLKNSEIIHLARRGPKLAVGADMSINHREYERTPMSGAVKFFDWNQPRNAEGTEISGNGIFLRTRDVLAEGAMVTLRVTLPGIKHAFTVLGKVVRTARGGLFTPPGMGVRFVDLAPSDRRVILEYVARRAPQLMAQAV